MAILLEANSPTIRRNYLVKCYVEKLQKINLESASKQMERPLGPTLWIAGSSFAANAIREQLPEQSGISLLHPGVRTLRQAAETLASMSDESWHPLSKVQQRWLVGRIAEEGKHSGSLGPLQELAASRGLVDLLCNRFDQTRELGLSIEAAGTHLRRSEGRVGNAMSRLYETYCERLKAARLFDKAARFDLACREIAAWQNPIQLLVVDSLIPNSPTEKKLLAQLILHSEETLISVVGRPSDRLGEATGWTTFVESLGDTSAAFVEKRTIQSRELPNGNQIGSLSSLSANLFAENVVEPSLDVDQAMEVIASSSIQEELRQVARRVKLLLINQMAKPNEIVVVSNQIVRHATEIDTTFSEYGIPAVVETYPMLKESAWVRVVLQLLEVASTDWQQEPLLAILGRRELKAIRPDERHDAVKLIHELGLPGGGRYLIQQAESLGGRAKDAFPPRHAAIAKNGLGALIAISDALDKLPEKGTPLVWFDALCHAVQQLKYESHSSKIIRTRDRLARETLEASFIDLELLANWRGGKNPELTLSELLKLISNWSDRIGLPTTNTSEANVFVVSAETAIGLNPKHLFIVRLDESSFAANSSRETIIDDSEAEELEKVSSTPTAKTAIERILFQQLTALPAETLTFSYAALDEKAVTLHPSPYLTEVERLFPLKALRKTSYRLGAIDLQAKPYSLREQRLQAVGSLVEGKIEPIVKLFDQQNLWQRKSLSGVLEVVSQRWRGDTFGFAEGICSSARATEWLTKKFGSQHHWSASQLEMYANCPYKFFTKYLLDANPLGDSQFEVDYRRRGTLLHDAMVTLHSTLSKKLGRGDRLSDLEGETLSELFRQAVTSVASARGLPSHEIALGEIEQEQTLAWAELYPKQLVSFDKKWSSLEDPLKPQYYEARFGPMHRDPDTELEDQVSTDEPYPFQLPNGEVLLLTGKIDRIDVGEIAGQTVFGIVDYKTGSKNDTKKEEVISGKKIQLVLYALAAEELFFDADNAIPIAAGYWDIKEKGFLAAGKLELANIDENGATLSPDWADTIEAVRTRVGTIVEGVRHGEFPMHNTDKDCGKYCDYKTICRVGQARNRDKLWPPPNESPTSKQPSTKKFSSKESE